MERVKRRALQVACATALLAVPVAVTTASGAWSGAAPQDVAKPLSQPDVAVTAASFANPPASVRPKYRWWLPLTNLDDTELQNEVQQMKDAGAGGFEIVPFSSPGTGNTSNPTLETNGFGTPYWSHTVEVMTKKAADTGLIADQTIGVRWPPAVNTMDNFNDVAAAKRLDYGREVVAAGGSRSGPIPTSTTAAATITTTLCSPATVGATSVRVASVSNLAPADSITIGTDKATVAAVPDAPRYCTPLAAAAAAGDTNLKVTSVTGLGAGKSVKVGEETVAISAVGTAGATGTGVTLSAPLSNAHSTSDTLSTGDTTVMLSAPLSADRAAGVNLVSTAKSTLIAVLVAQCASNSTNCTTAGTSPRLLDLDSVKNVTDQVDATGNLAYTFPQGNGQPWFVIDFFITADGQSLAGYTSTTPNYITDHLSTAGAKALTDFYDQNVFNNPETVKALQASGANGVASMFEDSLELGNQQKWTPDMLEQWKQLRGYDVTKYLPALAGLGAWAHLRATAFNYDGAGTPYFDFGAGSVTDRSTTGSRVRWDYAQTWSDLFYTRYVKTLQTWAESRGLTVDFQTHGEPIDGTAAGLYVGSPQGEGLEFNDSIGHPITQFKIYAAGANMVGNKVIPCECTAISGQVWATTARQELGIDGTNRPGVNAHFAGGMNWVIYHGFPYYSAPAGSGAQAVWPGYSYGGNTSFSEVHSPRVPKWIDEKKVNDYQARNSLVLREGKPKFDVGVYGESLGTAGQGAYRPDAYFGPNATGTGYEDNAALAAAGYTYSFISPEHLKLPTAVYQDGVLFKNRSDYKAVVLTNQPQIRLDAAQKLLALAQQGLPVVILGSKDPASITTSGNNTADDAAVKVAMTALYALADDGTHKVVRVATEAGVPAVLAAWGITADAAHTSDPSSTAIVANHRQSETVDYYYLYNQTTAPVTQTLTLKGAGVPYKLDAWTGKVTPIADYTSGAGTVTVRVRIAGVDNAIVAVTTADAFGVKPKSSVHATGTTADAVVYDAKGDVAIRDTQAGTYTTTLADGRIATTTLAAAKAPIALSDWSLTVDSWTPGPTGLPGDTAHTDVGPVAVTAGADGKLPAWSSLPGLLDVSGIGTYTTTVNLPSDWSAGDGAYLDLGGVRDTSTLWVNGTEVPAYDLLDATAIDLGPYLHAGANALKVRVASTLLNAVRVAPNTGAQNRTRDTNYGLTGPVVLTPYAQAGAFSSTSVDAPVGGSVPATLSLTLGAPASFGPVTPGVAGDYTASTTANVVSTAGDAALSVSDPGHLTNGAFSLPESLQVSFSKSTWTNPVSNDPVTIAFKQHINASDALRTGAYSKTLTFTLSTTTP